MAGADRVDAIEEDHTGGFVRAEMAAGAATLWSTFQEHDVAWFGIKPFAAGSLFKGNGASGKPLPCCQECLTRTLTHMWLYECFTNSYEESYGSISC